MTTAPMPLDRLPEEDEQFRKAVRAFAEKHVAPVVRQMDDQAALLPALLTAMFDQGLMGVAIPRAFGGRGGTFFQTSLLIEELARVDPAVAVCADVQNALVNDALLRFGTDEQRQRYLPALARSTVGAYAVSEADAGSDAFAMKTRADRTADGFALTGRKRWTTNGAEAGLFVVFANTTPQEGPRGITVFLVEREMAGVSLGRREEKMGIRASSTCDLILEGVQVPERNVLGAVGGGRQLAVETLSEGRIGIAAQMVGLAAGALEAALAYTQKRRQFGQPIASFQAVSFALARMATEVEAARLMVYNAARSRGLGLPGLEWIRTCAMAKYFASEMAERVASESLDLFGGYGYVKDCPVEKLYRDCKVGKIYEGTSNIQLRTIAATLMDAGSGPR